MSARFGVAARQQQACFRKTLIEAACSPDDDKGRRHGHLLALGYESQNLYAPIRESAFEFFQQRHIKWWTNARSGDDPGNHPTRNLASSQIACVNFLLPLASLPDALTAFLRLLDRDVEAVVNITDATGNSSPLEFEWVGWDRPLEGGPITRGANQTSVDALIVADTTNGRRAYLFEWKYCEEYRRPAYKGDGASGDTRRKRYQASFEQATSPFNQVAPLDEFLYEPFYQIMRLELLGQRMVQHGVTSELRIEEAKVVVVCPRANSDYREAVPNLPLPQRFPGLTTVEGIMCANLRKPNGFSLVASEDALAAIRDDLPGVAAVREWARYHAERYVW